MLIASTRHFTQGALDLTDLRWDPAARTLSGTLDAIADTGHGLRFLLPAAYTLREVEVSVDGTPRTETVGRLLKVDFHARNAGPVHWRLRF